MSKIIEVTECDKCPYLELVTLPFGGIEFYQCDKTKMEILPQNKSTIPQWCPLVEYNI